jgi:xanthosine utilization system XapX-like protein
VADAEPRRYRFGPLERRGVVGGLRAGQVAVVASAFAGCVLLLNVSSAAPAVLAALALAIAGVGVGFYPFAGRTLEQWLPVVASWVLRRGRSYRSGAPTAGTAAEEVTPPAALPRELEAVELLSSPLGGDEVAVLKDRRANTYTAVLAIRVGSFGLLDRADQERRLAAWGFVLAGLARENSPVRRIQWIERTVPSDGDELARYLQSARDATVPLWGSPVASYIELVESAGAVTQEHELFLALQLDARRAWRQIKRLGRGDAAAAKLLVRELETLAQRLVAADIQVVGVLPPRMLARTIRDAYDPYGRTSRVRLGAADPALAGTAPSNAWPTAAEESWSGYRSDSGWHATYWISQWPRLEVGATFLSPLLMQTNVLRTIAVTLEPVAPSVALRKVEAARTTDIADEETRRRTGFVTTARKRLQQESTARREQELADGHAEFRFAGFVTVSARDEEELERACAEVEHAAQQARLDLQRLYGQQATGFTFTLPLARGLR